MQKHYDGFDDWDGVMNSFEVPLLERIPEPDQVFADYTFEGYEGSATVIWKNPMEDFYTVHGGHCSCYGLENQWEPETTTREALVHIYTAQASQPRSSWNYETIDRAKLILEWLSHVQ